MPENHDVSKGWAYFSLGLILAAVFLSWWLAQPPLAKTKGAPASEFSAERAMEHIVALGSEVHPAGSAADDRAFEYLKKQVQALGLEMAVIDGPVANGGNRVEYLRAVLGRVRGAAATGAFAIDAHFDSTPYSKGAADDVSGIAAMLETARAIKAGPPLKNDVIFVFADQEEVNAGGAKAFTQHPWFQDVAVMLGLETRGVRGPALMFETSEENGWVIRELARSGVSARANSIMFSIYNRLPFGSDFGRYKKLVPGYNVAYIDGFGYYHTWMDRPDKVSLDSVQHHGSYTLGLARHLGNIPLVNCRAPNATYFNPLGSWMVVYPQSWDGPLSMLVLALLGTGLVIGMVRGAIRFGSFLAALGAMVLTLALSALVCAPSLVALIFYREASLYQNTLYCTGFILLGVAVNFLFYWLASNRLRAVEIMAATACFWVGLLIPLQKYLSGGAHLVIWPLMFGSVALILLALLHKEDEPLSPRAAGIIALWMLPVVTLIAPLLVMMAFTLTPLGAFMLNMMVVLVFGLMAAPLLLIAGWGRWKLPLGAAVLGALLLLCGFVGNRPSPDTPKLTALSYAANFDTGENWWLSSDRTTEEWFRDISGYQLPKVLFGGQSPINEWTAQFFPDGPKRGTISEFLHGDQGKFLKAAAPAPPFEKFAMTITKDHVENGRRFVTIHMVSPRGAQDIHISKHFDGPVYSAILDGQPLSVEGNDWHMSTLCLPKAGVELALEINPGVALSFSVREESWSCAQFPQYKPRPDYMVADTNRTIDHGRGFKSEHTYSICTVEPTAKASAGV